MYLPSAKWLRSKRCKSYRRLAPGEIIHECDLVVNEYWTGTYFTSRAGNAVTTDSKTTYHRKVQP